MYIKWINRAGEDVLLSFSNDEMDYIEVCIENAQARKDQKITRIREMVEQTIEWVKFDVYSPVIIKYLQRIIEETK